MLRRRHQRHRHKSHQPRLATDMRFVITGSAWLLLALLVAGCSNDGAARKAFFDEKLTCPSPAVDQFEPWGQSGSAHICKIKQGSFIAFESGRVQIRGQYDQGKEAGVWRWYGADGKVEKEIDYSKRR